MASVRRSRKKVVIELSADELAVLRDLPEQLGAVYDGGPTGSGGSDPVRDRLFPRAYLDPTEEESENEWQDMVHPDLVRQKSAALATLAANLAAAGTGGSAKLTLTLAEAEAWLTALNDARLALGVTIGITEDHDPGELDPDDPAMQPFFIYDWLTWVQGALVEVML